MIKTKRNSRKLFTFMIVLFIAILFHTKDVSAAANSVKFIDVSHGSPGNKGDATLITYNNKYYLIDTGVAAAYKKGTPLYDTLNSIEKKSGAKLDGIIITHCHADHMGALKDIINTSGLVGNNTKIYFNNTQLTTTLKDAQKLAKDKGATIINVKKCDVYDVVTGELKVNVNNKVRQEISQGQSLTKYINYDGLFLYGSTLSATEISTADDIETAQNNASMIVQLKTSGLNALLLGDLLPEGANRAYQTYGTAIATNKVYYVCKVGHHGIRPWPPNIDNEITNLYSHLRVKQYVFTIPYDSAHVKTEGHKKLRSELSKGSDWVKFRYTYEKDKNDTLKTVITYK